MEDSREATEDVDAEPEGGAASKPDDAEPSTSSKMAGGQLLPSTSRVMRNMAEKMRRDKLNTYISELATLVPMVARSPKRLDKTSILRLTATYLRMNRTLFMNGYEKMDLPIFLEAFNLSQHILQELEGFMLIMNGRGQVVFVSHTIESLLGHQQNSLMGHKLEDITCKEDHAELTKNLTPDPGPAMSDGAQSSSDDSSSDDTSTSSLSPRPRDVPPIPPLPPQRQRRSFYLRLIQRCGTKPEVTQYELVHVVGHLRVPQRPTSGPSKNKKGAGNDDNDIMLVSVVKLFKESHVTKLSLLEATQDEYVTRHLFDGSIINSDHRISVVAGYMVEEVAGLCAFKFMHEEDVRNTMIALKHMYDRCEQGEGVGSSCYRLQSKTGQYIYLRTYGYVEYNKVTNKVESFICINTLVSEEEGIAGLQEMRTRYSATILGTEQLALTAGPSSETTTRATLSPLEPSLSPTSSSIELTIPQTITNLPPAPPKGSSPLPVKAVCFPKSMPSTTHQVVQAGMERPSVIRGKRGCSASGAQDCKRPHRDEDSSSPELLELLNSDWDGEVQPLDQQLTRRHQQIHRRLHQQATTIDTIQQNLQHVPNEVLEANLSQLMVVRKQQEELLQSLQQDHRKIHCKEKVSKVCTIQHNVGV